MELFFGGWTTVPSRHSTLNNEKAITHGRDISPKHSDAFAERAKGWKRRGEGASNSASPAPAALLALLCSLLSSGALADSLPVHYQLLSLRRAAAPRRRRRPRACRRLRPRGRQPDRRPGAPAVSDYPDFISSSPSTAYYSRGRLGSLLDPTLTLMQRGWKGRGLLSKVLEKTHPQLAPLVCSGSTRAC